MSKVMNTCGVVCLSVIISGCAGGAEEARQMPTPVLCKTILDLSPTYVRYDEFLAELNNRGEDCAEYLGETQNIRVR